MTARNLIALPVIALLASCLKSWEVELYNTSGSDIEAILETRTISISAGDSALLEYPEGKNYGYPPGSFAILRDSSKLCFELPTIAGGGYGQFVNGKLRVRVQFDSSQRIFVYAVAKSEIFDPNRSPGIQPLGYPVSASDCPHAL
jgi:hypothetical protein